VDEGPSPFARVLHSDAVRLLSDSRSYERGAEYFRAGRVASPVRNGSRIECRVRGGSEYSVSLWIKGDTLAYSCTCPHALEGAFCKHCVAAAMAWLSANPSRAEPESIERVARFLAEREKSWLVRFLLDRARQDRALLDALLEQAWRG
jgi:uncharacterized Zn finger protein